jgi:hypothetical protein
MAMVALALISMLPNAAKAQASIKNIVLVHGAFADGSGWVQEHKELVKKVDRLDEWYIEEVINGDLYNKFSEKYRVEREELERRILSASKKSSNLENASIPPSL